MIKNIGLIYEEDDYSKFKRLPGNRDVTHSKAIEESIKKVGYRNQPILVNRNMEIIDGQNRFEACKNLGLPIIYTIDESAGTKECRSLNVGQKNWSVSDFVKSFADVGNEDYKRLNELIIRFGGIYPARCIYNYAVHKTFIGGGQIQKRITDGRITFSSMDKKYLEQFLLTNSHFLKLFKDIGGRSEYAVSALHAFYKYEADMKRLYDQLTKFKSEITPFVTRDIAFREMDKWYDYGLKRKLYIYSRYIKGEFGK